MALTVAWSESIPDGSESKSLGDNRIREFKVQHREFSEADHVHPTSGVGDSTLGYHKLVRLVAQGADPSTIADIGQFYVKLVSSVPEIFWRDDTNAAIQLTSGGKLRAAALDSDGTVTKTGDWIISSVTTARTGWTNVSATYSDKFMRINATPLTTGGVDTHTHGAGSYSIGVPAPTNNFGTGASGGATDTHGHTLTGSTASANNIPAFVQVVIFQKD